ncbi:ATP synthase subunit s, mitochondrial-like isoform X3 [Halichondria panicea]|uniref:ATP synthase subunit s, mitochondrial-like isoform X3 n=1 Tax=Halichondria panicea TaxID=6063 RepID=UPI00312B2BD4
MLLRRTGQVRQFWSWVNFVFNRVDHSRVAAVGPDRAAAEWVLRLGGSVKFTDMEYWNTDYNRLPSGGVKLEQIDGSGMSITSNGLEHLEGLACLRVLKLSRCKYLYDDGLVHLSQVEDTLRELDLSHCPGITHKALAYLSILGSLQKLDLTDTPGIRDRDHKLNELNIQLPQCKITA